MPAMTPSSKSSRSRYSSSVWPGATPALASRRVEARFGALAQFGRLVDRAAALADRKARQDRLVRVRAEGAALGDLDGGGERLRQIGKQRDHFGAAS